MSDKNAIQKKIGQVIRDARTSKNFSQEALAEASDLHPTYISKLETGRGNPTIASLKKIADSLGEKSSSLLEKAGE